MEDTNTDGLDESEKKDESIEERELLTHSDLEIVFQDYPNLPEADRKRLEREIQGAIALKRVSPELAVWQLREWIGSTLARNKKGLRGFDPGSSGQAGPFDSSTTDVANGAPDHSEVRQFFEEHVYPNPSGFFFESPNQFMSYWSGCGWMRNGERIDWRAEASKRRAQPRLSTKEMLDRAGVPADADYSKVGST